MGSLVRRKIRLANRYSRMGEGSVPWPAVVKLVLTHRCNLRCDRCFQRDGSDRHEAQDELDFDIIRRLIGELAARRPDFILSGGEPLLYARFRELAALLEQHHCFATICTNGTKLGRYRDLFSSNRYLSLLISLDGTSSINDEIRGRGVYRTVTHEIRKLRSASRPPYIGVQFTLRENNIDVLDRFCEEMVDLGVDWILLNPFWFLTPDEAARYESFLKSSYAVRPSAHRPFVTAYRPDTDRFVAQLQRIRDRSWPIQISSYFSSPEQIRDYIHDTTALSGKKRCAKQWVRMDVTPTGDVTPCIQFPDIAFGSLKTSRVMDIWNHPDYAAFRQGISREKLPVCVKCNNLYLYDANRKYL